MIVMHEQGLAENGGSHAVLTSSKWLKSATGCKALLNAYAERALDTGPGSLILRARLARLCHAGCKCVVFCVLLRRIHMCTAHTRCH